MNGIHDVGGMHGLGPIRIDRNEPVFASDWERQAFSTIGLYFAGGLCPIEEFRHSVEVMDPAEYLSTSYYIHWLHAMETLAINNGLLTKTEIDAKVQHLEKGA